ncbi:DUF4345 domain-containing protein [Lutimonas zeaxanthinifaciens]|uniref:DUF4345 domain-containing protein n=1 Tax=Lutimonas zeaxanthinifaciens TaxID=3060215 RepID=UPI00265CF353|nr:DUF4345 domain-containing protein [Lutimonas sp. YSD2104]WKK67181.1 DUF4345 domain-containing protein [Lutimonas sp. YSD2104]
MDKFLNRKNLHLILCVVIVIPAGYMYGIATDVVLTELISVQTEPVDLRNLLKAVMFLYFGIAMIWVLGIIRPDFWRFATLLVIVFMGCLVLGRTLSWIVDGRPSLFLILGLFGELILCLFGLWQYRLYGSDNRKI